MDTLHPAVMLAATALALGCLGVLARSLLVPLWRSSWADMRAHRVDGTSLALVGGTALGWAACACAVLVTAVHSAAAL